MKNFSPLVVLILALSALGLWGCGQQKTGVINTKIRELETRYGKLEDDFRALNVRHEQSRKSLAESEELRSELEKQKTDLSAKLDGVLRERENVRKQLSQRTQERDHAHANLAQFGKDLQALVGRVESVLNSEPQAPGSAIIPASRRNE